MAINPIYLIDPNGQQWQIVLTDAGIITPTPVTPQYGATPYVYVNGITDGQTYQIATLGGTTGYLTVTQVANGNFPLQIVVRSTPGGILYALQVNTVNGNTGILQVAQPITSGGGIKPGYPAVPQVPGMPDTSVVGSGPIKVLTQADTWELDKGYGNWQQDQDVPIAWWENTLDQQQIGVAKVPVRNGTIGLLYVGLAQALSGTGIPFIVPADWTPYILYGVLAELLSADGPSFDPVRYQYCVSRYEEGIELAKLVLEGA